jgi:pimeloyl-ACP methyl ester carboxylesterase
VADLRDNPLAVPGSRRPRRVRAAVNGTTLYTEVRGAGPPVLLIPGGAEDAEGWRPVAERLHGCTVITYDRRGTLRSGREDWPGEGSSQHAADAAALLGLLGLGDALVFGGSSAGIIAVQLALGYPTLVRRVLAFEPGYLQEVPDGRRLHRSVTAIVTQHLADRPGDWAGAYARVAGTTAPASSSLTAAPFTAPAHGWHARRELLDAEPFWRDDVPILSRERVDRAGLAASVVEIRLSHGTLGPRIFPDIAASLARARGAVPDVIDGVGHACYLEPDRVAAYIDDQAT